MEQPAVPVGRECLFCGVDPADECSAEDVFPKWLQRKFSLGDQTLTLLNGSKVKYRQLVVPACATCNNVHASQLEERVSRGAATDQELWVWLLKLQLGTMYWETGKPFAQDRRDPLSAFPIVDRGGFDISFLHGVFQTLRHPQGRFVPSPMGSVFRLPAPDDGFDYSDSIYVHPLRPDSVEYSAAYVQIHEQVWIVLFDDAGHVARSVDHEALERVVDEGRHPKQVWAELMWLRSRYHFMPKSVVLGEPGAAQAVTFLPPLGQVELLEARQEDLDAFYRHASR